MAQSIVMYFTHATYLFESCLTVTLQLYFILLTITIKENSWIAKIAAYNMQAEKIAIVIGKTIHLHNTTRQELLSNKKWLRHEVAHVYQWLEMGRIRFVLSYLFESFNKGYLNNRFEVEARKKENDASILQDVRII